MIIAHDFQVTIMERFSNVLLIILLFLPMLDCRCVPGKNCKLPDCLCFQKKPPGGLDYRRIPQIVIFTFDDAVRTAEIKFYNRLFNSDRLNPNGCPITMTLFVQDDNTEYGVVRSLYKRGMEIAVHSISHKSPQSEWKTMPVNDLKQEIYGQKMNIHQKAGVPLDKIRGWRSPYLQPTGNSQYGILSDKQHGFWYDSTLGMKKRSLADKGAWPFTLDHTYPLSCESPPCPTGRYPGLWEFLITEMIDNEYFPRTYVDSYRPENVSRSLKYLMQNFKSYHGGSRAPFMINMHSAWFFYEHNLIAMDKFIKSLLTYQDVYILTIQQALEWVKSPVDLSSVMQFKPWQCDPASLTTTVESFTVSSAGAFAPKLTLASTPPSSGCIQGLTCRMPDCRCSNGGNPGDMSKNVLPQMVLFTFDGAVNALNYKFYKRLFPKWRKNPNASPISMTLFLSDEGTDYSLVKQLYDGGMEIAAHNSMQLSTSEFWKRASAEEIQQRIVSQKNKINQLGSVPLSDIQGWRSPHLQPSGDNQFDVLRQNGFIYDSTLSTHRQSVRSGWPFTLDFGWNQECLVKPCPAKRYPGLWVVPLVEFKSQKSGHSCYYVDACLPGDKPAALKYLWRNFETYYRGNRAPFLLNIHYSMKPDFIEALDEFIRDLNDLEDVYIVNVQEALHWLKRPTKLTAMRAFSSWFNEAHGSLETDTDSVYNNNFKNGTGKRDTVAEGNEEEEKPDWIILVLIAVAAIFCSCIVLTAGMYIVRKHQIKKRAGNVREAMTVTSERNSVTDWLNTFPRRLSQLSCSNIDTLSSQGRVTDNVNFNVEADTETSTDQAVKKLVAHSNSLTLDPKLLENNYSRDMEIWNRQERKIPHIVNKRQKKKPNKKASGLPLEAIERHVRKKREAEDRKPWAFVWDPCESQSHSESVHESRVKSKTNGRGQNSSGTSNSTRCNSKCSVTTEQVQVSPVGHHRVAISGCYDFGQNESNTETICSGVDNSTSPSSKYKPLKNKDIKRRNDTNSTDKIVHHSSTLPKYSQTLNKTKDVKSKPRRTASSVGDCNPPRKSTKNSHSFNKNLTVDKPTRVRRPEQSSSRHSSGVQNTSSHRASDDSVDGFRDPRITKEMEIEWERDLRKQLDKFLKSKHALKGLANYR